MIQTPENIETSTMTYVFDMFGKSVSQMLQASINQQVAIDELRAQLRSVQTQLSNVVGTLEEFEDRIFVKVQEMRPTIYTRDGIPLDDALEMVQNKVSVIGDRNQSQTEQIDRIENEIKNKVDLEIYENDKNLSNNNNNQNNPELFNSIQEIQKTILLQKQDIDQIGDKVLKMVQLKLDGFADNHNFNIDDEFSDGYITKKYFDNQINKIKESQGIFTIDIDENLKGSSIDNSFSYLQAQQDRLDELYNAQKEKIASGFTHLLTIAQEEEEEEEQFNNKENLSDDFIIENDTINENNNFNLIEKKLRSISIDTNNNINFTEIFIQKIKNSTKKRNIGLVFNGIEEKRLISSKNSKKYLINAMKKEKERAESSSTKHRSSRTYVDETKIASTVMANVVTRVENMLIDFFNVKGVGGVKLDKNDAKVIIQELSTLQNLKEEMKKLKLLLKTKLDLSKAEKEFEIRITKDDFFNFISTLFPNNPSVQKALSNIKKGLPLLKSNSPRISKNKNNDEEISLNKSNKISKPSTAAPNLIPSRQSKLLTLNQKYMKGADGRYYMKEIPTEFVSSTLNSFNDKKINLSNDYAFDFQPFLPPQKINNFENKPKSNTPPHQID